MRLPVLQFGRWIFSPGLTSSISTLLFILLFVYLGFWQTSRYSEKLNLQKKLEDKIKSPILKFTPLFIEKILTKEDWEKIRYSQLQITGQFINTHHILLDNQTLNGQVGYRVITPFLPTSSSKMILVDRGWIPLSKNRDLLPAFTPILGTVTLHGMMNNPTSPGLQLKKIQPVPNIWPLRVQSVDFEELSVMLKTHLYPFMLQLNPGDRYGFKIPIQFFTTSATRHLGYAIQWFTLALASLIYYLAINSHRSKDAQLLFKKQT